ncbi:MAG: hypothetical protein AW07_02656 [Candidatus Accumulibacter sp. SK-11]|nr:MAG: hypothetical protein AW07_02656 [Candidatus Accumulibacter sp. SK-11]
MDDDAQPVLDAGSQIGGGEEALEKEDRLRHSGLAQAHRLVDVEQGKTVGDIAERRRSAQQPVTVGVRLHHRPGPRTGGAPRRVPTRQQIVVPQRREIDLCLDRARHQAVSSCSFALAKSTKVSTTRERKRSFG